MHIKLNALRAGVVGQRKRLLIKMLARYRSSRPLHQRGEHARFARRQRQRFMIQQEIAFAIAFQLSKPLRLRRLPVAAAQQRAQPRIQLIQLKRLGQVVVGAAV